MVWALLLGLAGIKVSLPPLIRVGILNVNVAPPWAWIPSLILAIAGFGILEAACRWFCRDLRFSDSGRADFSGRSGQILGWWILWVLAGRRWNLAAPWGVALDIATYFLGLWGLLELIRWFVAHVQLISGRRFSFQGGYSELLGWEVLLALSVLTVIGWAWVLAAMYRWMAANTRAQDAALRFHGVGRQILWRTLAAMVFSIPIVTIPWAWLWYARWMVGSTTMEGQPSALP